MASVSTFLFLAIIALFLSAATASSARYSGVLAVNRTRVVTCTNKAYKSCFMTRLNCPAQCPTSCFIDCSTCKAVCTCDKPGGVCQDPRFVGGDGVTFYFHGQKDKDFCIVTDTNLHINAHFIGKRKPGSSRDFTWVQSIVVLFDNHRLYVAARRTAKWDPSMDRLDLAFDDQAISLPTTQGTRWEFPAARSLSITRTSDVNDLTLEVPGKFAIRAVVVPITKKDSLVHHYGIAVDDDCFAHLDLGFKFHDLSENVSGVLGQTYSRNYVNRMKLSAANPVMGGDREFLAPDLFSAECRASRFTGVAPTEEEEEEEISIIRRGVGGNAM